MRIQQIKEGDYDAIIPLLNQWWNGRLMTDMLPRLFFKHFQNTSFIIKDDTEIIGFIIGFISQSEPNCAYVHFIGVHPAYRNQKIGKSLYQHFFSVVKNYNIKEIECVTSPKNKASTCFHKKLGFSAVDNIYKNNDQIPYFENYDGIGEDRVVFKYIFQNEKD
ncbi:MAG: GNAT family N-acetyltransferase [Chitinophagales bacterium]|nr:GNAT family N-acetyltransferase [Chitinophagales bacterium]